MAAGSTEKRGVWLYFVEGGVPSLDIFAVVPSIISFFSKSLKNREPARGTRCPQRILSSCSLFSVVLRKIMRHFVKHVFEICKHCASCIALFSLLEAFHVLSLRQINLLESQVCTLQTTDISSLSLDSLLCQSWIKKIYILWDLGKDYRFIFGFYIALYEKGICVQ